MIIRAAQPQDAAEIANVHINSWREAYKGLIDPGFLDDRPLHFKDRYELWKQVTAAPSQTTFVAESSEHGIVGFVNGNTARDKGFGEYVEVYCIYLLQKYHNQGVGFRLLKNYFDAYRRKGFSKAYLWVLKDNPTIRFYEKTGARSLGQTKQDEMGGKPVEEICYVWDDINLGVS